MNVSLTSELESWVDEKVRTGRYASASEVIREALRLLQEQELAKQLGIKASHVSHNSLKVWDV